MIRCDTAIAEDANTVQKEYDSRERSELKINRDHPENQSLKVNRGTGKDPLAQVVARVIPLVRGSA